MCQSPRITDALLRTNRRIAANDNDPVGTRIESREPRHSFKGIWRAAVIMLGAGLLL
jgi:hypothetical protein